MSLPGDVLKKTDTGGLFVSIDPEVDQRARRRGRAHPDGADARRPRDRAAAGHAAHALEDEAIAAVGATREDFARPGRDLPGARRPVLLRLADTAFSEELADDPDLRAVRLRFTLPAGGYATVVVASVTGSVG